MTYNMFGGTLNLAQSINADLLCVPIVTLIILPLHAASALYAVLMTYRPLQGTMWCGSAAAPPTFVACVRIFAHIS